MGKLGALLEGVILGAGLMYFFDPERGRRRRALLRDQVTHGVTEVRETVEVHAHDLRNRIGGAAAEFRSTLSIEKVPDTTLVETIRARMGHVISHPQRVHVMARFGRVTITGSLPAREVDALYRCIASVRGVVSVDMNLQEEGAQVEGASPVLACHADSRPRWSPGTLLLVGAVGGALAIYGKWRGGLLGSAVGTVGAGLLTGSIRGTQMRVLPRTPNLPIGENLSNPLEEEEQELTAATEHRRRPLPSF